MLEVSALPQTTHDATSGPKKKPRKNYGSNDDAKSNDYDDSANDRKNERPMPMDFDLQDTR